MPAHVIGQTVVRNDTFVDDISETWPAGTAAGDLAVALALDSSDDNTAAWPAGWTQITGSTATVPGQIRTLDAGAVTDGITATASAPWDLDVVVSRGVIEAGAVEKAPTRMEADHYTLPGFTAGDGPYLVVHAVMLIAFGAGTSPPDTPSGLTLVDHQVTTAAEIPDAEVHRCVYAELQTSAGTVASRVITAPVTGGWGTRSYALPVDPGAGIEVTFAARLRATVLVGGGTIDLGAIVFAAKSRIRAAARTGYPRPAPSTPTLAEPAADEPVIVRWSLTWPAPTLVDGVPQGWEPS
jgi:hypothetical protein